MTFLIRSLPPALFEHYFAMTDAELAAHGARRTVVALHPGTPCRVSLSDAEAGETVILLNYEHQPADSPYRSSHAIFVRQGVAQAFPARGEVPEAIRSRLLSVRLFDADHMMIDADVVPGHELASVLDRAFDREDVGYAHLHNAKPGCFAAAVVRAP